MIIIITSMEFRTVIGTVFSRQDDIVDMVIADQHVTVNISMLPPVQQPSGDTQIYLMDVVPTVDGFMTFSATLL